MNDDLGKADRVGIGMAELDGERLEGVTALMRQAWTEQQFSGAAWGIGVGDEPPVFGAVGTQGDSQDRSVSQLTLFDAASVTKPVATASSVLSLLDRGEMTLLDGVRRYYPDAGPRWDDVTIRHLLTHTSGLPAYAGFHDTRRGVDEIRKGILGLELKAAPGERYEYSCLGYILLQNIVTAVTGQDLASYARKAIFQPAGMNSTTYRPDANHTPEIAVTGECPHRGRRVHGEVHDPLAWAAGGVSGNAGLFTNVQDLCRFGQSILACYSGEAGVLSPAAARLMLTNQIDPEVGGHTLGLFAFPNGMLPRGDLLPTTTVGHTGFTGTSLVLVPAFGLCAVLLTNCLYHGPDKSAFFRTRRRFHNLVGASIRGDVWRSASSTGRGDSSGI